MNANTSSGSARTSDAVGLMCLLTLSRRIDS